MGTDTTDRHQDTTPPVHNGFTAQSMVLMIGDTTWRMFVPSVGMTLLGVWLDSLFGTKPWLMIAGIIVGAACAVLLVKMQLQKVRRRA
jgi:hypothetical protein